MKYSFKKLLLLGVLAELLILLICYLLHPELEETFRYAARYSGRLSAVVFLVCFYQYAITFPIPIQESEGLRNIIRLFAILHIIHFGFLATNIYLNEIPLIPIKLVGGALAYLMIVIAPFQIHKVKKPIQLIYFYYVSLVMIITYIARFKGDFEGAEPHWIHYVGFGTYLLGCFVFSFIMLKNKNKTV